MDKSVVRVWEAYIEAWNMVLFGLASPEINGEGVAEAMIKFLDNSSGYSVDGDDYEIVLGVISNDLEDRGTLEINAVAVSGVVVSYVGGAD